MMHHNHIFASFPLDGSSYCSDVGEIAGEAIRRYGEQEWRCAVLACELHGHVGIYNLLGVKMGLFARQQLDAEPGQMRVVSRAGAVPPVSCFNDGLQVATSSTLGHGLIEVQHPVTPCVEAEFECGNRRIQVKLKEDYARLMASEVEQLKQKYGERKEYWDAIRGLAIDYWLGWSRDKIFEVV